MKDCQSSENPLNGSSVKYFLTSEKRWRGSTHSMFHRNYITNLQSSTLRINAYSSPRHYMNRKIEINPSCLWTLQHKHWSTPELLCQLKVPKDLTPNASLHDKEWKHTWVAFSISEFKKLIAYSALCSHPRLPSPKKEGKGENDGLGFFCYISL